MKFTTYFVVVLLIFSSIAALGIGKNTVFTQNDFQKNIIINKNYLEPTTLLKDSYIELKVEGTNGYIRYAGEPLIPISRSSITLPFGTKIVDIICYTEEIQMNKLNNKIIPTPEPIIYGNNDNTPIYNLKDEIYTSSELYPDSWFYYNTAGGLDENNEHKTFLTIQMFPVRYNPVSNTIIYTKNMKLKITFEEPNAPILPSTSIYNMVIIAPNEFSSELQRLITHKNKYNLSTFLKTTEEIYSEYNGVDKPEKIKYYIKDAIETLGINYVLLVGGMNSLIIGDSRDDSNQGTTNWYLPVRYTNLREIGSTYDPGFISDLYYADIYDGEGNFSSWDSDRYGESDGIFAVWKAIGGTTKRDIIDLYPDVSVGRLACRSINEVKGVVTKIIDYERFKHEDDWYNNMVAIGGDSHDDGGTDYLEGEVACDFIFDNYMTKFNPIKLYSSNGKGSEYIPSTEAIQREVSAGCGYLLFEGHGHPGSWNTHWPGIFNWQDTPGGIQINDFYALKNDIKLPICVIGGCHNSQFNVTLMSTLLNEPFTWTHGIPVPECFAWHLVRMTQGGTIASLGNTGLGYGAVGEHGDQDGDGINLPDTVEALGGYQIRLFFETLDEGKEYLGDVWVGATKKYLDTYPGMKSQTDAKTVEQWPLLGDPSLKIGGYQTDEKVKIKPIIFDKLSFFIKIFDLPIFEKILQKYYN